jgi:hypothetical protein
MKFPNSRYSGANGTNRSGLGPQAAINHLFAGGPAKVTCGSGTR